MLKRHLISYYKNDVSSARKNEYRWAMMSSFVEFLNFYCGISFVNTSYYRPDVRRLLRDSVYLFFDRQVKTEPIRNRFSLFCTFKKKMYRSSLFAYVSLQFVCLLGCCLFFEKKKTNLARHLTINHFCFAFARILRYRNFVMIILSSWSKTPLVPAPL